MSERDLRTAVRDLQGEIARLESRCAELESQLADALNTRSAGTCKINHERYCTSCGVYVHKDAVLVNKSLGGGAYTVVSKPVSYCPNCGRAVKRG